MSMQQDDLLSITCWVYNIYEFQTDEFQTQANFITCYIYTTVLFFFSGLLFSQEEKERNKQTPNPDMFMACKFDQLTTVVIKCTVTLTPWMGRGNTEPSNPTG